MTQAAPYLLIALLAFASGWVWRGVYTVLRYRRGTISATVPDLPGDLLYLDWSDPRPKAGVVVTLQPYDALKSCDLDRRIHYFGAGDTCQCGELPSTFRSASA